MTLEEWKRRGWDEQSYYANKALLGSKSSNKVAAKQGATVQSDLKRSLAQGAIKQQKLKLAQKAKDASVKSYEEGGDLDVADTAAANEGVTGDKVAAGAKMAKEMGLVESGGVTGGAISGAATGYTIGGPWGAAIGGAVGGVAGAAKAKQARKAEKAERKRKELLALGENERKKGEDIQNAYNQMTRNMLAAIG